MGESSEGVIFDDPGRVVDCLFPEQGTSEIETRKELPDKIVEKVLLVHRDRLGPRKWQPNTSGLAVRSQTLVVIVDHPEYGLVAGETSAE